MTLHIAEENSPLSFWEDKVTISYKGYELFIKYETEPPHGDFIYSVLLPNSHRKFPYWVYGRNLVFLDSCYLIAESVEPGKWSPVTSMLINIQSGLYVAFDGWYPEITVKEVIVELHNDLNHRSRQFCLNDLEILLWRL